MKRILLLLVCSVLFLVSCTGKTEPSLGPIPEMTPSPINTLIATPIETITVEQNPGETPNVSTKKLTFKMELSSSSGFNNGPVYSLDWSPDGRWIAAAGYQRVDVWDLETGEKTIRLQGSKGYVWGVDWSPDGTRVAAASDGGLVQIWNPVNGEVTQTYQIPGAFCLNWSPDSTLLAAGAKYGTIFILDTETGEISAQKEVSDLIIAVKWSPDGTKLAAAKFQGQVEVMDAVSLKTLFILDEDDGQRRDANGVDWSPDGQYLVSAHQDGEIRVWGIASEALVRSFSANHNWVRGVAWSPDGKWIATGGNDRIVRLWDVETGQMLAEGGHHDWPVWSVTWSPDGMSLASGEGAYESQDCLSRVFIWEIQE